MTNGVTGQEISAPWTAKRLDANHSMVHDANGMTVVPRMITEPGTPSAHRADLIAAAPDLLEALWHLVEWQAEVAHAVPLTWLEKARAAIAKAGGK